MKKHVLTYRLRRQEASNLFSISLNIFFSGCGVTGSIKNGQLESKSSVTYMCNTST